MTEPFLEGVGKLWETPLYGLNEGGLGMKARNWSLENKTVWGVGAPKCITHKSHWPSSDLTDALLLPSFNSTLPTVFSVASAYSFWASFSLFWSTREEKSYLPGRPLFFYIKCKCTWFWCFTEIFLLLSQVIIVIPGIKCFPHKCHPSIFHLHLEDTNVALVSGKIVACTSEQKASLRLSHRVLPSRWSCPGTPGGEDGAREEGWELAPYSQARITPTLF